MKFYVTTPIYYVNDIPHIGHAYTTIAADIVSRFKKLSGYDVFFLTGTDEHGKKVEKAAAEKKIPPQELADEMHKRFKELWKVLNIKYSRFVRTTEKEHKMAVEQIWKMIQKKGDIYMGKYSGWYCVPCETFWPPSQIKKEQESEGMCPTCSRPVEFFEEPSYFFRSTQYKNKLLSYLKSNNNFVKPSFRMNEVVNMVENVKEDLSISRYKLSWGIPVPVDGNEKKDSDHTIYVWFDALVNYLTGVGFPDESHKRFWPPDLHIVGKDILKFHAVYWPMFLMSAGIELPKTVFAHGWWKVRGEKMSKSLKNVVDPFELSLVFGADAIRYFMFREISFGQDGEFSEKAIRRRYETDLAKDLGNLVLRVVSMVEKYFDSLLEPVEELATQIDIDTIFTKWSNKMENLEFPEALSTIWELVSFLNGFIDKTAPWTLYRKGDLEKLKRFLWTTCRYIKFLAFMLFPFIPNTSIKIFQSFGIDFQSIKDEDKKKIIFSRATINAKNIGVLFPKV